MTELLVENEDLQAARGLKRQKLIERFDKMRAEGTYETADDFVRQSRERKAEVARMHQYKDIDSRLALEVGMYVTHASGIFRDGEVGENLPAGRWAMEWMADTFERAKPGESVLIKKGANYLGGMLDLGEESDFTLVYDAEYGTLSMQIPLVRPPELEAPTLRLGSIIFNHALPAGDTLLVGADRIGDYARGHRYGAHPLKNDPSRPVDRDLCFLRGLYQAGLTATECGVPPEVIAALAESDAIASIPLHESKAEFSLPQIKQVLNLDRLPMPS